MKWFLVLHDQKTLHDQLAARYVLIAYQQLQCQVDKKKTNFLIIPIVNDHLLYRNKILSETNFGFFNFQHLGVMSKVIFTI